ncbi:gliding motility lipoprotein GldD [Bizionia gelidisalsuginis]|uniref:Gliding motility lipoprotein GldD n=2 Tax=Bizionia TaxID=283785 RepID=A0A8H2QKK0_9FLAO|nr:MULTISPECIES: gliding motility lipoprotein GldD [Bizionia]TYB70708.1 gliding motility lipoprotein GldD [Bizionia saleffrena]TYC10164.1 gliding motility lipoprotein GldD [Bizionia gelidisalsuginis]
MNTIKSCIDLKSSVIVVFFFTLLGCNEAVTPKPKAFLRLEYPEAIYNRENLEVPFSFDKNELAEKVSVKQLPAATLSYGVNVTYKKLKGTIYLTYKNIEGNEAYLRNYLIDAQNFTQEHTKKADGIAGEVYENKRSNVYGMYYEVNGDAASQAQFYVTDSTNHFLIGSLYFYAKPNYDSIYPAAKYLQKDIKRLMESITWK